jgi:hypothetical protein
MVGLTKVRLTEVRLFQFIKSPPEQRYGREAIPSEEHPHQVSSISRYANRLEEFI